MQSYADSTEYDRRHALRQVEHASPHHSSTYPFVNTDCTVPGRMAYSSTANPRCAGPTTLATGGGGGCELPSGATQPMYAYGHRPQPATPFKGPHSISLVPPHTVLYSGPPSSFYAPELPPPPPMPLSQSDFYGAANPLRGNEFFYYTPPTGYGESPMPSSELCSGSCGTGSIAGFPSTTPATVVLGSNSYADPPTGSFMSGLSRNGSRFPQWYVPRGVSTPAYAGVGKLGGWAMPVESLGAGSAAATAMGPTASAGEEETLRGDEDRSRWVSAPIKRPPPPPACSKPIAPAVLPSPHATSAAGVGAPVVASSSPESDANVPLQTTATALLTAAAQPTASPFSGVQQPFQFFSYNGRAYGVPRARVHDSEAEGVAAMSKGQPAAAKTTSTATDAKVSDEPHNNAAVRGENRLPSRTALQGVGNGGDVAEQATGPATPPKGTPSKKGSSLKESPLQTAVQADLLRRQRIMLQCEDRLDDLPRSSEPPACGTTSVITSGEVVAATKSKKPNDVCPAAAASTSVDEETALVALSPIPRCPARDEEDADLSYHSLGGEVATKEASRQDVLNRVLAVPGAVWRHDPYSRCVIQNLTSRARSAERAVGSSTSQLSSSQSTHVTVRGPSLSVDPVGNGTQPPHSREDSVISQISGNGSRDVLQPSARRIPSKKVSVRHFVNGAFDISGALERSSTSKDVTDVERSFEQVKYQMPRLMLPPSKAAESAGYGAEVPESVAAMDRCTGCTAEEREHRTRTGTSHSLQGSIVNSNTSKTSLPRPRSQHEEVNAKARGCTHSSRPQESRVSSWALREDTSMADKGNDSEIPDTSASDAVGAATAASWPVLARRENICPSPFYPSPMRATKYSTPSWAWRARSPRESVPSSVGETPSSSGNGCGSFLDELDTSGLVSLWRKLEGSGCFQDALDRRRSIIGDGCNSSSRVMRRTISLTRRLHNRRRGEGCSAEARFTTLDEASMKYVCLLQHRYRQSTAVSAEHYEQGTTVVVDGDMGVDTGVVELVVTRAAYEAMTEQQRRAAHLNGDLEFPFASSIHRAATAAEVQFQASTQTPLEDATLQFLQFLSTRPRLFHSCRIDWMQFIGVEFQADGQKLYVHYSCKASVRFLELATYLNHIFHCRVWMRVTSLDYSG